ncbi:MAG TPA: class II aldolase/adducin family protein [Solirubrobacteraceae bacterium]|jgi:L-fuculose-phosphate aldolase
MTVWVPAYSEALISDHDRRLIVEVAWASRILAMVGYEDLTLGHVSARGSDDSTIYIKRKGVALGEVTPEDILAVDLGTDTSNGGQGMHLETVLHTEVYKRRPDVRSVVHGHPPYATAFGATDAEFAYLTHDSVLFIDRVSTYDGVPDLIVDEEQGAAVAEALGASTALLLRNHGVLVAERDVQWAVLASALLERAIQLQAIASSIGPLHPIPDRLLRGIHAVKYQSDFAGEYWGAWIRTLRRGGQAFGMPEEP